MKKSRPRSIPLAEFSGNLETILEEVVRDDTTVLVESESGALIEVKRLTAVVRRQHKGTEQDYQAFLASAGGWRDVDVDAFLKDNAESRKRNTRPPVDL